MIGVTQHAAARYQERVKPALEYRAAKAELLTLLRLGEVRPGAPDWRVGDSPIAFHVELSDGIAALLNGNREAITVICRSGMADEYRRKRNQRKAKRRSGHRISQKKPGRRPRIEEEAWPI